MRNVLDTTFSYRDGSVAKVGDRVLLEERRIPAIIKEFIRTEDQLKEWGLEEPGVMFDFESGSCNLIFIPDRLLEESQIERV